MDNARINENANKAAYFVAQYPDKKLQEIIALFVSLPAIEINTAIWRAVELGWIEEPTSDGTMSVGTLPENWEFGKNVNDLEAMLLYAFGRLAEKEQDLEENYLNNWCAGFRPSDVLVAELHLLQTRQLATYELTDPKDLKSTYTFYTLYENSEQMWGRKQFKEQPTGEEVPEAQDELSNDERAEGAD